MKLVKRQKCANAACMWIGTRGGHVCPSCGGTLYEAEGKKLTGVLVHRKVTNSMGEVVLEEGEPRKVGIFANDPWPWEINNEPNSK